MKHALTGFVLLGMLGVVQAAEPEVAKPETPKPLDSPEATLREMVTAEDVRFFLNEARQAARAAAKGDAYVPSPQTATRAREIGERLREKGFGLMEGLLDQIERELLKELSPAPGTAPHPAPERTQT